MSVSSFSILCTVMVGKHRPSWNHVGVLTSTPTLYRRLVCAYGPPGAAYSRTVISTRAALLGLHLGQFAHSRHASPSRPRAQVLHACGALSARVLPALRLRLRVSTLSRSCDIFSGKGCWHVHLYFLCTCFFTFVFPWNRQICIGWRTTGWLMWALAFIFIRCKSLLSMMTVFAHTGTCQKK